MQSDFDIRAFLSAALAEDIGSGDVTAEAVIPAGMHTTLHLRAREPMVAAGLMHLPLLFSLLSPEVQVTLRVADGDRLAAGETLATLSGNARAILAGERTALNFVQHLSGIATLTARYVEAVAGTHAEILDTRKTIPGLRALHKYAVRCGGGKNHRMGLYDAVLIKDNHIAVAGSVAGAIAAARAHAPQGMLIEVECDTHTQLAEAIQAAATRVLLDNMPVDMLARCVAMAHAAGVETEASGNVNLHTIRAIAETGVERISIGRLTHSARAVDVGLDAEF